MIRAFLVFVVLFCFALGACTQRTICPAFQSAFIYDKDQLRKKFSYFQEDSTPKILTASKNKYLIAEPTSYRKKMLSMATVEMKDIHPTVPDSLLPDYDVSLAELDRAARSIIDSTYIVDIERPVEDTLRSPEDTVYMITKDKEVRYLRYDKDSINFHVDEIRYNVDQDNYMWYLRDVLILPDVRLSQLKGKEEKSDSKEKKGVKGFFKNLFKKKKKNEAEVDLDSAAMQTPIEKSEFDLEYDPDEELQPEPEIDESEGDKSGLFGKKKDKKSSPKKEKKKKEKKVKEDPVLPDEEEEPVEEPPKDDGF